MLARASSDNEGIKQHKRLCTSGEWPYVPAARLWDGQIQNWSALGKLGQQSKGEYITVKDL